MNSQLYMLRAKKIGIKIAMSRLKKNLSLEDLASKLGIPADELGQMEKGISSPSLPQFQVLASLLDMPIDDLVNTQVLEPLQQEILPSALPRYYEIRNRMLGIQIKKNRFQQNQSVEQLAQICEIPTSDFETFESGQKPIPLPLFLKISEVLHLPYERVEFVESASSEKIEEPQVSQPEEIPPQFAPEPVTFAEQEPVNDTYPKVKTIPQPIDSVQEESDNISTEPDTIPTGAKLSAEGLPDISPELRDFITKSVNVPYLELAMKLSRMDAKKLRDIAESLLEITL